MFSSKKKPEAVSNNTHKPVTDYMIEAGINGKFKKSIIDLVEKLNELDFQQEKTCADYSKLYDSYDPNAANLTYLVMDLLKSLDKLAEFRENPGSTDRAVIFNECSKHIESIRKIYNEIQTMKLLVENQYKELSRLAGLLSTQSKNFSDIEVKINEISEQLKKKVTIGHGALIIEDKKTKKETLCDFEHEIDLVNITKQFKINIIKKKLDEESTKAVTIAYLNAFLPSAKLLYQNFIQSYQKLSNHQLQIIDKEVAEAEDEAKEMFEQFELLKSKFQPQSQIAKNISTDIIITKDTANSKPEPTAVKSASRPLPQPNAPKNNYANQQKVFGSTAGTNPKAIQSPQKNDFPVNASDSTSRSNSPPKETGLTTEMRRPSF